MKHILLLFTSLILSNFAFSSEIDTSKIRVYDREFYFSHPYQPFSKLITFKSNTNEVLYVASRHKECKRTQERIDISLSKKPDLIIIEGLHKKDGINSRKWDKEIVNGVPKRGCDTYYAYKKAQDLKIPYLGVAPGRLKDFSSFERDTNFVKALNKLLQNIKKS